MNNFKNIKLLNNINNNEYQNISLEIFSNNPKTYSETKSIYDFFILSLLKNTNISKEKGISLVFNFDKNIFKRIFENKEENNNQINLLKWITDIKNNKKIIENLFENLRNDNNESKNIFYKIISVGLYTNSIEIIAISNSIIEYFSKIIKLDIDWFLDEMYLIYINNINFFSLIRLSLIKSLILIIKGNENKFFEVLKSDLIQINNNYNLRSKIILFIENIFTVKDERDEINQFKKNLFNILQQIYFDYNLLSKQKDIPLLINLIAFGWINNPDIFINENNNNSIKNILLVIFQENIFNKYGINCVCSVVNLFLLLDKFGKIKNENGPLIYKTLVHQFISQYENELKREIFLDNFINFFFTNLKFPIDLFISPYLNKLKRIDNISLSDFNFISLIISHPRFTYENAFDIICLLLDYSFKNIFYTKCITMIINLIFSLNLLSKNKIIYEKTISKFSIYINDVLKIYKENITQNIINDIDKNLLEIVNILIIKKFGDLNNSIKDNLINCIEHYRKINNKNSKELLKLLWNYDIYDDILLNMEEKYFKENIIDKNSNKNNFLINNKKEDILKNIDSGCTIFKKVKKINIIYNEKNDKQFNCSKKPVKEINKKLVLKVENELKKINDSQKRQMLLEKEKDNLLKTREFITKQRLLKLFLKRGLILGLSKNIKKRAYSHNVEKRGGYLFEEGEGDINYPYGNLIFKRKNSKMKLNTLLILNKYKFIVDYFEEEPIEIKGIEALNIKYKNQLKLLYNKLIDNHNTISKSSFMKFLRENNITNNDLSLDELSLCIKNSFPNKHLFYFNENEFKRLLIFISYYIMNKENIMYTLFESYYYFLKIIFKNNESDNKGKSNRYLKIRNHLKNNLDKKSGKINLLLPPGFKIVPKVNISLIKQFPKNLNKIFSESTIICSSIIDEIILNAIKCKHGIFENYIKINKKYDIEIESSNIKPWSQDLMIAYSYLPLKYNLIGIEVASLLEEGIRNICRGKKYNMELENKTINKGKINNKIKIKKISKENNKQKTKINESREKIKIITKNEENIDNIKNNNKILKNLRENKEQNEKNNEKEKKHKIKPKLTLKIECKKFNDISKIKFKSDEVNQKTKNEDKINKRESNIIIVKQKKNRTKIFLSEQNKKIKEELEIIKRNRKLKELKRRNLSQNLPKINSNYFLENKEYIELDKNLKNNIKKILGENSKINNYLNKYDSHLKLIFDIYHKIGLNSITSINFIVENSLCYNEYKEFLINFGILNVFISMEQMNFIFKRLSRFNNTKAKEDILKEKDNNKDKIKYEQKQYLTYNDFKMSLLMILILSNMENDNIQIMKSDYDNLNDNLVELLFEYLEFIIPFYRRDLEDIINKRRNMNSKEFKEWKKKKRKDLLNIFNKLYINKDEFYVLQKKIRTNLDILPSFSDSKVIKVSSRRKIKKLKKCKNLKLENNIKLKKIKVNKKENKNNKNILKIVKHSNSVTKKIKLENRKNNKIKKNDENEDDMKSIDFSLSYTLSTIRDKEIGSIETNLNTVTNLISNKSEFIKEKAKINKIKENKI